MVERGVEVTRDDHRAGLRLLRTSGRPSPGRCATAARHRGWGRRSGRRPSRRVPSPPPETVTEGKPVERSTCAATSPRSARTACRDPLHVAAPLLRRREPVVGHQGGELVPETPRRLGQGDQVGLRVADQRREGVDIRLALVGVEAQDRERGPGGRVGFGDGHAGQRPGRHHYGADRGHREQADGEYACSPACAPPPRRSRRPRAPPARRAAPGGTPRAGRRGCAGQGPVGPAAGRPPPRRRPAARARFERGGRWNACGRAAHRGGRSSHSSLPELPVVPLRRQPDVPRRREPVA